MRTPASCTVFCAVAALSLGSSTALADECAYEPHNIVSFDADIAAAWGCRQDQIDDAWDRFHFDEGDWDDGFGWNDACNQDQPLMRTFNALTLMAWAGTPNPTCAIDDGNIMRWGYCWAGDSIDELDGRCGDGSERAFTSWTPGFQWTDLYWPFFYDETVAQRAGTLMHEARHAHGWCDHDGNCKRGASCDPNWHNGCVGIGSGSGPGANAFQVTWISWYFNQAQPDWISPGLHQSAFIESDNILADGFEEDPGFRLASDGTWMFFTP